MKTLFCLVLLAINTFAAGPQVWSVNTRADVMRGDARGVSIDQDGTITLAPKLTEVYKTGEQFVWSSAVDANGDVYLGTGGDGKVFRVTAAGNGSQLVKLAEMNVTALAVGRGGEIFAGTSPDGKVYRIDASGKADVYFEPKEKYIWSLAVIGDGSLAVATGDRGVIYRVRSGGALRDASILFDTSETNVISLATDKQGNLYAGTDPGGIVMRFDGSGKPFGLLDSPLREIHKVVAADDGSIYVLALGESLATPAKADAQPSTTPASTAVTADHAAEPSAKSRYDLAGAKSALYRILPDGSTDLIWTSQTVIGFSIAPTASGVLVGTSDKGRIYSVSNDGRDTLALQTDASQISTMLPVAGGVLATSSNQGSLYRVGGDAGEGTYESAVLDAKNTATWGRVWWRSSGSVTMQTRSGNTEKPDETWSSWSNAATDQKGVAVSSPKARYIQWRATLKGAGASVNEVDLAFSPRNIAPEILSLTVLPTNVGLAPNPPIQVDPNIQLSGLDPSVFGVPVVNVAPRKIYQRAAVSLQWTAEDRNGDKLAYDVYYREVGDTAFKLLRAEVPDNFITVDGQSLADGRYIFKVVARDAPSNPAEIALSGERSTGPVDIDNTPPTVTASGQPQVTGDRARVSFDAADAASYLTRAEYSVNGGDWMTIYAADGISDSPRERYTVDIPLAKAGEYAVTIRVYDVNGNAGNARVVVRK